MKKFTLAVCQIKSTENKLANISSAYKQLLEAKKLGAQVAVLGETFNCPFNINLFPEFAEECCF